jgi:hypothetical protein
MTRRAHPPELVDRALILRRRGYGYGEISKLLLEEYGQRVGASTVRDWVHPEYGYVPRRA